MVSISKTWMEICVCLYVQFIISVCLYQSEARDEPFQVPSLRFTLPFAVPGILYCMTNNLGIHVQLQMDPASYQASTQQFNCLFVRWTFAFGALTLLVGRQKVQHNTTLCRESCVLMRSVTDSCGVLYKQVSAVADEPSWHAVSRQTCCKQRWTLIVINLRPNEVDNACDGRRFRVIASICGKSPIWTYRTCIWQAHLSFAEILGIRKLESLGYCVMLLA